MTRIKEDSTWCLRQQVLSFPKELRKFYMELGYGFLKGDSGNINRLMDPLSVRDFRLKQNDFEYFPD